MSEEKDVKKNEPVKSKTVADLQSELKQLHRSLETFQSRADSVFSGLKDRKANDEREMNSAKARAMKPLMEKRDAVVNQSKEDYLRTEAKAKAEFESEILPAKQRMEGRIKEAAEAKASMIEGAKLDFNKAAEELFQEHKKEMADIVKKYENMANEAQKAINQEKEMLEKTIVATEKAIESLMQKQTKGKKSQEATQPAG